MNTVEILKKARELISDRKRWTQNTYCRVQGKRLDAFANEFLPEAADCFCAIGSLARAGDQTIKDAEASAAFAILSALTDEHGCDVHEFNDTHSHIEVLALFDRAVARAESEAA